LEVIKGEVYHNHIRYYLKELHLENNYITHLAYTHQQEISVTRTGLSEL
jgi:hypothetical protein